VRRGCNEGFTEIHLSGGEGRNAGSIIVMRRIKSDGTSQWKLNGADMQLVFGQSFLQAHPCPFRGRQLSSNGCGPVQGRSAQWRLSGTRWTP